MGVRLKRDLNRSDFQVDSRILRGGLLDHGYLELPVRGEHSVFVENLPSIHKDPFGRILVAQATIAGFNLLTADALIARYPGPIRLI